MKFRAIARMSLGIGLVLLGIVGLILPIMPGWIFVIPGLLILADYFPPIHRLVEWLKARFADAEREFRNRNGAPGAPPADSSAEATSRPPEASTRFQAAPEPALAPARPEPSSEHDERQSPPVSEQNRTFGPQPDDRPIASDGPKPTQ